MSKSQWNTPLQQNQFWIAERLLPIYYLPVYATFSREEKLKCNHFFALTLLEQIAILEDLQVNYFSRPLRKLFSSARARQRLGSGLIQKISEMFREEAQHSLLLKKLVKKSAGELPTGKPSGFFRLSPSRWFGFRVAQLLSQSSIPGIPLLFALMVQYFEERAVFIYSVIEAQKSDIDPLHFEVHRTHFRDEVEHVRLHRPLVSALYELTPAPMRGMCVFIFARFLISLASGAPAWAQWKLFRRLHPEFEKYSFAVRRELKELARSKTYGHFLLSPSIVPHTWEILVRHSRAIQILRAENIFGLVRE